MTRRIIAIALLGVVLAFLPGCWSQNATIIDPNDFDPNIPLGPGEFGLVKLDPKDYPDMRTAWADRNNLEKAINKSLEYLSHKSAPNFFPSGPNDPITFNQVQQSLLSVKAMLHDPAMTPDRFQQEIVSRFDVWTSKGFDRQGSVWFTAYFTPIYYGSRTPTAEFRYPIYRCPPDLVRDRNTGDILGQQQPDGTLRPYPTRRELSANNGAALHGLELMYFRDPMEPYIIQVQGSAKVILPDRSEVYVGYDGKNGRDYHGLGQQLLEAHKLDPRHLSLPAVLDYYRQHPEERETAINNSDSFVFLKEYASAEEKAEWPKGSLNVQVTENRSLATDKHIFPRASLTFIAVDRPASDGVSMYPYRGFALDQDTGGAIRAAGRADIYVGIGDQAGQQAGHQYAKGRLYYIFLKPQFVPAAPGYPELKPTAAPRPGSPAAGTPRGPAAPADPSMFPGAHPGG